MLEFRASFYILETTLSRDVDWRMPQPPAGGQHTGGSGGGDGGDGSKSGGEEGNGSGGEGSSEKRFAGKGLGVTSSGSNGSGGKGSGGKGSGGKGSGGKHKAFGSRESRGSQSHCEGSRASDMRDEAALRSYQVRVYSHLFARTLFHNAEESLCQNTQPAYPVDNTLVLHPLEEGERLQRTVTSPERQNYSLLGTAFSFCLDVGMPTLRSSEGVSINSLSSSERRKVRIDLGLPTSPCGPSAGSAAHTTILQGEEHVRSNPQHLQLGTVFPCSPSFSIVRTQDWSSRKVLEGPAAGVLETWAIECQCHASEGASIDFESKSTAAPGEEELSQEAHVVQREEETQQWPPQKVLEGLDAGVLETGASEHQCHASEGASGSSKNTINIGDTEEVLHSGSPLMTQEDDVKGGQWTFVEGKDRGDEGRAWTFVEARLLGDVEGEEEPVVEAQLLGYEKGEERVVEARLFGSEVSVGVKDTESAVHSESRLTMPLHMDPKRKDRDSPSTRCGEEQGDRAFVVSTGREMVLHEAIELVSDSVVVEVPNIESSVDVGTVARQEADFTSQAALKICVSVMLL
ncbi:hypothetical protein CBR_g57896 [Chara braunii]|uniref:Uncharacterized protein n=1 Tax=Chara braunii TaxID=69332 RepID=A0A388MEF8_CHABU|nr:hypothetical protein CBR_g57896 [Chara braunii]|eukprot:GBG92940.1 hypothetical protein CBR_g57896 [Chara braunii]